MVVYVYRLVNNSKRQITYTNLETKVEGRGEMIEGGGRRETYNNTSHAALGNVFFSYFFTPCIFKKLNLF